MLYYKTCPYCGAHLDPGEHCDCTKERSEKMTISPRNPVVLNYIVKIKRFSQNERSTP